MVIEDKKYVEFLWYQKYNKFEKGDKILIEKPNLPFQTFEMANKPRIKGGEQQFLYHEERLKDYPKYQGNILVWGNNKLVMSSLIKQGQAKINLIYIYPSFFTEADFTARTKIGDKQIEKEPSYLKYTYEQLVLMRELLAENGSIYVHLDWHVGNYVKVMIDKIFGCGNFRNEIVWNKAI